MSAPRTAGPSALELLEGAIRLLRANPEALVAFAAGGVPFWLGLLYFLSDMSRSAYAAQRIAEASLGVAALFVWMKCWQCIAAQRLRAALLLESAPRWTPRRLARLALRQAAWQPWGLLARPLALVVTLPIFWVSSFFQNLTVLDDGRPADPLPTRAVAQAKLWPRQGHALLVMLHATGFMIWLNVIVVCVMVPQLAQTFFGIETVFTRSLGAYLNTTFVTASFALMHLCLEPIWKAAYVLRCFRGETVRTGEDLRIELKRVRSAAAFALVLWLIGAPCAVAAERPARVEAVELDRRISEVMQRREYAWRMPRPESAEDEKGMLRGWLEQAAGAVRRFVAKSVRLVKDGIDWVLEKFFKEPRKPHESTGGLGTIFTAQGLLWAGLAVLAALLAILGFRALRAKRSEPVAAEAITAAPDLQREDLSADALPEDGWLKMASDLAARGELRLALRAAWLAGLAHLGQRELVRIASYKSNREYDRELHRRARSREEMLAAFGENLTAFERSWYGAHEVTRATFDGFTQNLERIRAC